jgi:hypothetical protein
MKPILLLLVLTGLLHSENACGAPPRAAKIAAYGYSYTTVSAGWGASYRAGDNYYYQLVIDFSKYRATCLYRTFKGYGAQLTLFNHGDFSVGVKYYSAVRRFSGHTLIPYWGVSPSCFVFEQGTGINCKPLVGIKFSPLHFTVFQVDLDVSYGYDIPFVQPAAFTAGRHDLSATISLGINLHALKNLLQKDQEEKVKF